MVKAKQVWPIDSYEKGGTINRQPMEYSIGDAATNPNAQADLTEWVNRFDPSIIDDSIDGEEPYNAVIRAEIPSVEGPVPYDYLAEV